MSSITVTLTGKAADRVSKMVASGDYANAEAVVADALDLMGPDDDPEVAAWVRDVVTKRYDESVRDPSRSVPIDEVR